MNTRAEQGLIGNEKIENDIRMLQKEPSGEMLSVVLTSVRRRAQKGGLMIVPVEIGENGKLQVAIMQVEKEKWLCAFTGFEQQLKGKSQVMSTFLANISQLLDLALSQEVEGLIINPWDLTLRLDKNLIRIIKGEN